MSAQPMSNRQFPPRGSGVQNVLEAPPAQAWVHPDQLGQHWDWKPGRILLGKANGRLIGRGDERHVVTIAGSQAGKTSTVLIPNLLRYPGSCVVLDPKGELAKATAATRKRMGQRNCVFDPFGVTGMPSASYNPFSELETTDPRYWAADIAQAMDAIVINNAKDPHWTDAGKNLLRGAALHILHTTKKAPTLRQLRRLINGTGDDLRRLFEGMAKSPIESVANTGASFLGKLELGPKELQSILSTVQEQTASFDDVAHITERSDLKLTDMPQRTNTSFDDLVLNPERRLPCVIVADRSTSMAGEAIRQLNQGLQLFHRDLSSDLVAMKRVEVALVTFGPVVVAQDFATIDRFTFPRLDADNDTPMTKARGVCTTGASQIRVSDRPRRARPNSRRMYSPCTR